MNNFSLFSERLREVRKSLNKSQAEMAEICNVSREVWGKYELGKTVPGADVLIALANFGIDVNYILTGYKTVRVDTPLSSGESTLLNYYKKCNEYGRHVIEVTAAAVAEPGNHYQVGASHG